MNEFTQGAGAVGGAIAGFLNPLFGSETSTTTVNGSGGSTPESSTKISSIILVVIVVSVIGVIAFLVTKKNQ